MKLADLLPKKLRDKMREKKGDDKKPEPKKC